MSLAEQKKIFLIGAGTGDPELITLKAFRILQNADCVLYDSLINYKILEYCSQAEKICVGKTNGHHLISQEQIFLLLEEKAKKYNTIVRLKGGDPFVFARGGEEWKFLHSQNFSVEVIPGISAAMGAASSLLLPLTHRDYASQLILITGHKRKNNDYQEFEKISLPQKTLAVYMGRTALPQICQALLQREENQNFLALLIENATFNQKKNLIKDEVMSLYLENQEFRRERYIVSNLNEISKKAEKEKISSPALLIVGEVISFWQEVLKN